MPEGRGLVRMARCRLPDVDAAVEAVKEQLTGFGPDSWVFQNRPEEDPPADSTSPGPVQTGLEQQCTAVLDYYICNQPGITNPSEHPGCTYIESWCVEWEYVFVEDDPPEGGGGDSGDPCTPCTNDPDGDGEQTPCLDGETPQGCSIDREYEITVPDPCETGNDKIDDIEDGLFDLWQDSNPQASDITQRKEQGGWIVNTGNGFELQPFGTNFPVAACSITFPTTNIVNLDIPANTVGWVHSHPYEGGEDIGAVCGVDRTVPYRGIASIADIQLQRLLAINAESKNYVDELADFTGIVIDKDGIRITDGELGVGDGTITQELIENNTTNEQPCGYK